MSSSNESNPYKEITISPSEVRYVVWGADRFAADFEEAVMLYWACKGALRDLKSRGPISSEGMKPAQIERTRMSAFNLMQATSLDELALERAADGTYFNGD